MKQDSSWKRVLDKLLPEFLAFYFPEIYKAIDFEKEVTFLDKELQQLLPQEDETGRRTVDKLVKVALRDGSEKWLLIHIEVQGYSETDFPQRVFQCYYRIYDRFKQDLISVAVLSDEDPEFRKNVFKVSGWNFLLHFKFPVVKLLDLRRKWKKLERDSNPFAIVTMAFLKTVDTKGSNQDRYQWKKYFLLELYRRGLSRETILALFEFIGIIMALPEELDQALYNEIRQTPEDKHMSILAIAREEGIEEGRKEERLLGLREMISDVLEIKFGVAGMSLFSHLARINDLAALQKIRLAVKQAQSLEQAERMILDIAASDHKDQ